MGSVDNGAFVIFSSLYKPNVGGVEEFTAGLAEVLARHGHRVVIVTNHLPGTLHEEVQEDGTKVFRLPSRLLVGGRFPVPKKDATFKVLWRKVCEIPCAGVLVNTRFYIHSLLGSSFAKSKGLSPVVLDHGADYLTFGSAALDALVKLYEHGITGLLKRRGVRFYGISEASSEWLRTFGIQSEGVIGNAIDAEAFARSSSGRLFIGKNVSHPDPLRVCFVGRLIPEKGLGALVEAMGRLQSEPIELYIAGDGPLRASISEMRLPNTVLLGRLSRADLSSLYAQCDLFCLPSRSEGFCSSFLEACACGTPSLITRVGVVADVIEDERFGTLLGAADAAEVASKLLRLSRNRGLLEEQGRNARHQARKLFSWESTYSAFMRAFKS